MSNSFKISEGKKIKEPKSYQLSAEVQYDSMLKVKNRRQKFLDQIFTNLFFEKSQDTNIFITSNPIHN